MDPQVVEVPIELAPLQRESGKHVRMWSFVSSLLPRPYLDQIDSFEVFTDGDDGALAAVVREEEDPTRWVLALDIVDAFTEEEELDTRDLPYSVLHEFAHMLTLSESQIVLDEELLMSTLSDEAYALLSRKKEEGCASLYFVYQEGCAKQGSYINAFYQAFWKDDHAEIKEIDLIEDDEEYQEALDRFYAENENAFVTPYAATSVEEDIAESFAAFVLGGKPEGKLTKDLKINFFYTYEELASLRSLLRSRLGATLLE